MDHGHTAGGIHPGREKKDDSPPVCHSEVSHGAVPLDASGICPFGALCGLWGSVSNSQLIKGDGGDFSATETDTSVGGYQTGIEQR